MNTGAAPKEVPNPPGDQRQEGNPCVECGADPGELCAADCCTASPPPEAAAAVGVEQLARRFHETYERLAPSFGYETRTETRQFDPATPNGRLMVAVCSELAALASPTGVDEVARLRAALEKIARVNACDYEYRAWATAALAARDGGA